MPIFNRIYDRNSPLFISRISVFVLVFLFVLTTLTGFYLNLFIFQSIGFVFLIESISSYLNFKALSLSIREPDYVFNYGFGKYESFAIFISVVLTANLISYLLVIGFISLSYHNFELISQIWLIAMMLISVASIYWLYRNQVKYFERFKLDNLSASYLKLKKIFILLIFVFAGLGILLVLNLVNLNSFISTADILIAVLTAVFYIYEPLSNIGNSIDQLTDRKLPEHIQFDLIGIVAENLNRFCKFSTMHTRQSGDDLFIEIDIVLPWDYTIEQKFNLEKDLKAAILQKYPKSIFRLYVIPCDKDCIDENGCSNCPIKIVK